MTLWGAQKIGHFRLRWENGDELGFGRTKSVSVCQRAPAPSGVHLKNLTGRNGLSDRNGRGKWGILNVLSIFVPHGTLSRLEATLRTYTVASLMLASCYLADAILPLTRFGNIFEKFCCY